ncbi:hypothetical protein P3X46_017292 [Hevea brasiliensis]|uniref:Large ribosomal subunit protein bL32m n=1 Tax=Hevea brasiliensis TaxID=3981 RepID=A0ABQ9M1T5_HEVBR|nr:hypothetical protein P3X46_017292 [Hevea brasiliensis]
MAQRLGMLKAAGGDNGCMLALLRWFHIMPPLLDGSLHRTIAPPQMVSPEFDPNPDNSSSRYILGSRVSLPVSPHKRGIRNGPKALKPTPVIIRCRSCGRVKLPHFYCCSGDRGNTGEQNN